MKITKFGSVNWVSEDDVNFCDWTVEGTPEQLMEWIIKNLQDTLQEYRAAHYNSEWEFVNFKFDK
jgi:hypothetical protein